MAGLAGSPSSYIRVYLYISNSFLRITPFPPNFSDVIALAGTSGLPAAFCPPHNIKQVAKKSDQPDTAKLQA